MRLIVFLCSIIAVCVVTPVAAFPAHDSSAARCLDCHVSLPFEGVPLSFYEDIPVICSQCHDAFPCTAKSGSGIFGHPVRVIPSMELPKDMVLDVKGRMSCITCHVYHEGKKAEEDMNFFYLRRPPGMRFCYACHKNF